jgi:hypothetical protein
MKTKKAGVSLDKVKASIEQDAPTTKKVKKMQKTDEKTAKKVKEKVAIERESMYIYPADVTTLPDKKKFRTNARSKKNQWMKAIEKAESDKAKGKQIRLANEWAAEVYSKESRPDFN